MLKKRGGFGSSFIFFKIPLDFWATKVYNKITVKEDLMSKAGKSRKGGGMEGMTNEQFQIFLKMVIQILKDDKVKEETIKKIEALLHQ